MSKGKRFTQEFKEAAVKQITERGYSVAEVAERLDICTKTFVGRALLMPNFMMKPHLRPARLLQVDI